VASIGPSPEQPSRWAGALRGTARPAGRSS
jgi:hypothetical protein